MGIIGKIGRPPSNWAKETIKTKINIKQNQHGKFNLRPNGRTINKAA
jgi:hypothetical protein